MPGVAGHYAPGAGSGPGISNKPGDSTHPPSPTGLGVAEGLWEDGAERSENIGGWGHEGSRWGE